VKIIYKIFNKIVYITRSFLIVFITLIILLIILFIFGENFFCKNKVITSVISSNKKIKIVIFQRDCGATTGFTTQISIINSNEIVDNTMKGNIFISRPDILHASSPRWHSHLWQFLVLISEVSLGSLKTSDPRANSVIRTR